MTDQLTESIATQEAELLDSIGVTVDLSHLRIAPVKSYLYNQFYGMDFLSRLWCQMIRPKLFKSQQAELEKAMKIIDIYFQQEYLNEIMKTQ